MDADQSASSRLEISVDELKSALATVIGALEEVHGPTVIVDADFYWTLFVREQFDLSTEPPSPTAGQLTDDVESVRDLLANGGMEPLWHLLQHTMGMLAGAASTTLDHMVEVPAPPSYA
ncbi:hypothetical protein [uncultured Cellulomonas sp.]|uniref:hypothetical protein n=1 Tax=uncultured Cellulomonas sp. TaxID=189682 RepID=UPI0028F15232|nr:hypothetical protein [uncultured Cellulomonas sp.]